MKEILEVGGSQMLIPAVLFIIFLYLTRGLFELHGRRNQNRKEFLDLWNADRSQDDLWLEVIIRNLFGTYLPARIIRVGLSQPDKAQSLLDLSELWPLFQFDPTLQKVSWLHERYQTSKKRNIGRVLLLVGYFFSALVAVLSGIVAARYGSEKFLGWVYGLVTPISICLAFICLIRSDTIKTAEKVGEFWLARINRALPLAQTVKK